MSAQKIAALGRAKTRKVAKAQERDAINEALLTPPTDIEGISRLLLRVQAAVNRGYLTPREELGHERKLLAILDAMKASEFYRFRHETDERSGRQSPNSEPSDSLVLRELEAKLIEYKERDSKPSDDTSPVKKEVGPAKAYQ